jgi:hypothetical protein
VNEAEEEDELPQLADPATFLFQRKPDRTLWPGWDLWRRTRLDFVPAPKMTLRQYARLTPRQRRFYDQHRLATHGNLRIQDTPMGDVVGRRLTTMAESAAVSRKPGTLPGLMVSGGGYQGKTETVCEFCAEFEDDWRALYRDVNPNAMPGTRDLLAPVCYVRTPTRANPNKMCNRILDFYGEPYKGMNLEQLTRTVQTAIADHATHLLVIDDVNRLKLHRADDSDVLDFILELMSTPVTLVLIGVDIPTSGLLRGGRKDPRSGQWLIPPFRDTGRSPNETAATSTDRRFRLVDFPALGYDTPAQIQAFTTHLAGIEEQLRLLDGHEGMLTEGSTPELIYERTSGVIGLIEGLIVSACRYAMNTELEKITPKLLETCEIDLGDTSDLDADSGELPAIPPSPARRRPTGRKPTPGRNTVFDDHGPRQAADG